MITRLCRFYAGTTPTYWKDECEGDWFWICAQKVVQLEAEDELRLYRATAAAMGSMDETQHRQWANDLARRASNSDNQYYRPRSQAELAGMLNEGARAGEATTEVIDEG